MKTLILNLLLTTTLLMTGQAAYSGPQDACLGFYDKSYIPLAETKIQRVRNDTWHLLSELKGKRDLAIPERWKKMVENNDQVDYRYQEKTFDRQTQDGTKYTVSYHVLEPVGGKYKSTIVLQHGFAESAIYFASMTRILVAMGFRVIGMDGANAGHTLLHTLKNRSRYLRSPSPVEDGLALAEVLRLELGKTDKFILLGHSRGFATTSLALATGQFDKQLIKHISSNGYDTWKVDEIVDKQIYNPFFFIPGLGTLTQHFADQLRSVLRRQTNMISSPILRDSVNNHQVFKSKEEVGVDLAKEVTRAFLTNVTMEIASGLTGVDSGRHGFDNGPLYNGNSNLKDHDNGFGLVNPNARIKISHLSDEVKAKTIMIFGDADKLISKAGSKEIVDNVPNAPIELTTDRETGVAATHFLPSQRPFDLVEIILQAYKEHRANSRMALQGDSSAK